VWTHRSVGPLQLHFSICAPAKQALTAKDIAMRRFPSSWTATLSKLGLRIRRPSAKGRSAAQGHRFGRRMSLEQLESRQLLTGVPWDGAELVIADFDGDGNLDRLRAAATGSSPETWIIDSKTSSAAGTVETWRVTRGDVPAGVMPAANEVLVGDFNGDGRDDFLSKTGMSNWYIITSRAITSPSQYNGEFLVLSNWNAPSTAGGWSAPVVGDFNGDGRDDLAAFDATNPADKQWQVSLSTGVSFQSVEAWATQSSISPVAGSIVAGDFNGDGRDDLLFRKSGTSNWAIAISDGSRFNAIDPSSPVSTAWTSKLVGDFDGDGAEELLGWNTTAGRWETVRYNDHRGMSLETSWGNHLGSIVTGPNLHIGDANRDKRDDLVVFDATAGVNKWKVALSQQTAAGASNFVYTAAAGDGTNDWDRWFKDWDWGPSAAPYKFLNIDAPYQKFLDNFSDVYNNVELELYPGLMKGIEATAQTKAGNDWDQAALLVERLEPDTAGQNEGQRARIASGKVNVEPEKAKEWIGTTEDGAALNVIAQTLDGNATIVGDEYQFTHAWVQALVPSTDGLKWIDVDPSWKFKDRQSGEVVDIADESFGYTPIAGRSSRGTFDEFGYLQNAGTNQLPVEWYEDQVMKYLVQENKNKSLAEAPHDGPIIQKQFGVIPVDLGDGIAIAAPASTETYANFAYIAEITPFSARLTHRATVSVERGRTNLGNDFRSDPQDVSATSGIVPWNQIGGSYSTSTNSAGISYTLAGTTVIAIPLPAPYSIDSHTRLKFDLEINSPFGIDPSINYYVAVDSDNTADGYFLDRRVELSDPESNGIVRHFDVEIGSNFSSSQTVNYVIVGMYKPNSTVYPGIEAIFSKVELYKDYTTLVDGTILKQVGSEVAELDLPVVYTVTKDTVIDFEFKSGDQGLLHAIGWDSDFISSNDSGGPARKVKIYGTSTTLPSGFAAAQVQYSGNGWMKFSVPIGAHLTGTQTETLERLLFITDGSGSDESQFRNLSLRDSVPLASVPIVVGTHSLDSVTIDYSKQDNLYTPRVTVANSTTVAPAGQVLFDTDDAIIRIQHASPSEFDIADSGGFATKAYYRTPGQIHAVGFDANQYSPEHIIGLQAQLNTALADGALAADIAELLSYTSAKYWYELNRSHRTIDGLLGTVGGEQWVGSGIITADPYLLTDSIPGLNGGSPVYTSEDLKHLQFPILPYNMGVDLPNTNHGSFDVATGAFSDEAFQLSGYHASALENAILEEVVNSRSISTIRGVVDALTDSSSSTGAWVFESVWESSSNSRRFYRRGLITESLSSTTYNPTGGTQYTAAQLRTNTSAGLISVHSDSVVEGIVSLLENSGSQERVVVLVPNQKSIVDSWSGSVYVAEFTNNDGSHGAYIIAPDGGTPTSGGYSGNVRKPENEILPPSSFLNQTYAGDPVNVANGNMFRDEVDFRFANPIIPLDFSRHYDSQNKLDVGFGVGWVHGFTGFIYEEQDPANSGDVDYVWLRGSGERHTFESLDFTLPNTLFGDVITTGSGTSKRLTAFKDRSGTQYLFEGIAAPFLDPLTQKMVYGRMVAIKDASGHQGVNISYESANSVRVAKVASISTPSRYLQFTYGSNTIDVKRYESSQLVSSWGYILATDAAYIGKRLTQVRHADQTDDTTFTSYQYYMDGPASRRGLIQKITEPNDESHSYEYYANGRVFRVTDGAGKQQSFNYNLFRNLTEFTDENGHVETYIHQDNGLLLKQIHNDRSRLEFTWGQQSSNNSVDWEEFLMESSTDERGVKETFYYHPFEPTNLSQRPGELRESHAKDGTVTTYTYRPHDYISSVATTTETPLSGTALQTAEYTYDDHGHILTAKDAAGNITKYEYYDATAPAHLRGLRKSETRPKGVSNQLLAAGETYEAVPWKVLSGAFPITGDTISVQLRTPANGQSVVADAIRIDRLDKDGVLTRIIDSNITAGSEFRLGAGGGTSQAGTGDAFGSAYIRVSGTDTEQTGATWIFRDLEPGTYRISASWQESKSNSAAKYWLHKGLPDGASEETITGVNQADAPADFRSYQTIFEYDSAGNPTRSVTEGLPAGRRAYDRVGNLVYEEDAKGVATVSTYDSLGRLSESKIVDPKRVTFAAGSTGNVQSFHGTGGWDVSPSSYAVLNGGDTLYLYDGARKGTALNYNVTAKTVLEFDFEAVGNLGEFQAIGLNHSLNAQSVINFALAGTRSGDWPNLVNWQYHGQQPNSGPHHYRIPIGEFVAAGNYEYLTFINYDIGTVPSGPTNEGKSYFSNVRLYESADSAQIVGTTTHIYDDSGRVRSTYDALDRRTSFDYDGAGRLIKTTFHDRTFTTHEYDDFGNCIATTDELGRTTRYVYDDRNRLIQTIYADGNSTRSRYDGTGQVVSTFDEHGTETRFTYDKAGRLLTTTAAVGLTEQAKTVNKYDNRGRRVESVDANRIVTKYRYDSLDRLVQTTVLDKSHSPNDTTLTQVDTSKPPVHVSTIEYDSNGNVARAAVFDPRKFTAAEYATLLDDAVNLITTPNEDENKVQVVRTAYDAFGRVTNVTNADGTSTSTIYDAAGRVRFTFDELDRKVEQRYDQFGRLERIVQPDPDGPIGQQVGSQTRFVRNALGNVTEQWELFGNYGGQNNVEHDQRYLYDIRNRRTRTVRNDDTKTIYVYDAANQLVATIDSANNATYTTYDTRGRIASVRGADPDGAASQFAPVTTHTYDAAGNIASTIDPLLNVTSFTYDKLNRLKSEERRHTQIADDSNIAGDPEFSTAPTHYSTLDEFYGRDVTYWFTSPGVATWKFENVQAGDYQLAMTWRALPTYDADAPLTIRINGQPVRSINVNQQKKGDYSSIHGDRIFYWTNLGDLLEDVPEGATITVELSAVGTPLMADAVRLDRISTTEFGYDKNGNLTSQKDSRGYTTTHVLDELGRTGKTISADPDGALTTYRSLISEFVYDGYGNVIVEYRGHLTSATTGLITRTDNFTYDRRNRLIEEVLNVNAGTDSDDNVTTLYEYDAVGNTTLVTDAEQYEAHYRYDNANRLIDEYRDFGEGRDAGVSVPINANSIGAYGPDGTTIPSSVSFPDANSVQLAGNAWKKIDIIYMLRHNTVLEFDFASERNAEYQLIGFDTNDNIDGSDFPRFFELAGTNSLPNVFQAEFHREILPDGSVRFHIPVGQYLAEGEKVSGLAVSRLVLANVESRTNLDPADRGTSTFSNIRLYESDEVRTVRSYDTRGNVETIREASDPRGIIDRYEYDLLSRVKKQRINDGDSQQQVTDYQYDSVGNLKKTITYHSNNEARETLHEYDRLNRRIKTTLSDPDGTPGGATGFASEVTTFKYDVAGNLIAETNGENETVRRFYDSQGDLISEFDGNGDETRYRYDSEGNLTAVIDGQQNATRYKYDGLNRVTQETITAEVNAISQPLSRSYVYSAAGNLERVFDRNNRHIHYVYDSLDRSIIEYWRPTAFVYNEVPTHVMSWAYDKLGRVTKQVDGNASYANTADDIVDTFTYDGLGRLVEQRNYDPETFSTQGHQSGLPRVRQTYDYFFQTTSTGTIFFDRVARTQTLVTSSGETPIAYTQSEYDRLGRLANFTDEDAAPLAGPSVERKYLAFAYELGTDNLTTIQRRGNHEGSTWQNILTSTLDYDKANRLKSITHDANLGVSATDIVHAYAYDNASRVRQFNTLAGATEVREFTYDDSGQLTARLNAVASPQESYTYDDNGNRKTVGGQTVTTGRANRLASDGTYTYEYDKEGNVTFRSVMLDPGQRTYYSWDHRNRLTKVSQWNGDHEELIVDYRYDASGRLVYRKVDRPFESEPETEYFTYDGDELALSFAKTGSAAATLGHRYLHSPVGQVLVDEVFNTSGHSTDSLWLLGDHQGTSRDIVDDNGVLRKHTDFDSFGKITNEQLYAKNGSSISSSHAEAVDQAFAFTGEQRDTDTGLQLHGERWYDPRSGRWLSEDPLGLDAGDANLYRYVGNSPLNYTDPTGTTQAGNPLTNLNLYAGGYTGGTVAPAKPANSFVATGFKNIFSSVTGAAQSVAGAVGAAIDRAAVPFHSAIDTATYFAAANEWLSHDFIADGTFGGGNYRGGKYIRNQGTSVSTQLELFNFYAGQQPSWEGSTRSGLVSFGSALFNQPTIQANVSAGLVAYGTSRERSFANLWDTVKLWDNQVVAQNVANLVDQGSSIGWAAYGGAFTAIGDNVGVSSAYSAYEGKEFYGSNLSAWERTRQGALGSAQLVGTAFGLKAPVTAGARTAYNVGVNGVKSLGSISLDISAIGRFLADEVGSFPLPSRVAQEARGGTYVLRDVETGQVMRTGRTNDLLRREAEHARDTLLGKFKFDVVHRTDSYAAQRGLEQELDWIYNPPQNYKRPIDPYNPKLLDYLRAANDYLDGLGQ